MPIFYYKAVTSNGELVEGVLDAPNLDAVIERLRGQGHTPIRAGESAVDEKHTFRSAGLRRGQRLGGPRLAELTRQLATLLGAGLDLDRALTVLADVNDSDYVRALLQRIQNRIHGGGSLSDALAAEPGGFSRLYINMVRAGEQAGALEVVLQRLAEYLDRSLALKESVKSALIYPMVLVAVSGLSVIVLITFVLPRFAALFENMGSALPWPTQVLMTVGTAMREDWWIALLAVTALVLGARRVLQIPSIRVKWDSALLAAPLLGDLLTRIEVARFSRTLGTLLQNGIPILSALAAVKDTLGNRAMVVAMTRIEEALKQGRGLAEPLAQARVFPRQAVHMVRVGEESGRMEEMLERVADAYDREVQTTVNRLLALLEPVVILGLGGVVAAIVLSLLVAIMGINNLPM